MSFVENKNSQISLDDSFLPLTKREHKFFLEKSWAKTFAEVIFTSIDKEMFSYLYSSCNASKDRGL